MLERKRRGCDDGRETRRLGKEDATQVEECVGGEIATKC